MEPIREVKTMRAFITALGAAVALAVPGTALAHHGPGGKPPLFNINRLVEIGTGTFSSGTLHGRPIDGGTYTASVAATGAATSNNRGFSCAPASGTVTLTGAAAHPGTITQTVTGKLCTATATPHTSTTTTTTTTTITTPHHTPIGPQPDTSALKQMFFGKFTVTAATGEFTVFNGHQGAVGLSEKADGSGRLMEFGRVLLARHDDNDDDQGHQTSRRGFRFGHH